MRGNLWVISQMHLKKQNTKSIENKSNKFIPRLPFFAWKVRCLVGGFLDVTEGEAKIFQTKHQSLFQFSGFVCRRPSDTKGASIFRSEGPLAEGTKVVVRTLPVGLEMAVLAAVEDRRLIRQRGDICFEAFPVGCGDCLRTNHKVIEILASGEEKSIHEKTDLELR